MKKKLSVLALAAVALAGGALAQAIQTRAVSTEQVAHVAVGNTENSIDEVREALGRNDMRATVSANLDRILTLSEDLNTPFEFERDLFVCEELHSLPADHGPEHPESAPLAACVENTFKVHQVGQS